MKRATSILLAVFIGFCVLVATDRKAYGYVDAGTAWMAVQGVGSMAAAAGYFMRRRIKALFTGKDPLADKKPAESAPLHTNAADDSANRRMTSPGVRPTFRDPAGSLSLTEEAAVRTVRPEAREAVLQFLDSAFYKDAVACGEMSATLVAGGAEDRSAPLILHHPRIAIPSYPWEWTSAQWLAAAELTLSLGRRGINAGFLLKDATPLNILFDGTRPVLVDVLSFERRDPKVATWLAYGQYMRTFLLPLLANRLLSWPLAMTQLRRDGYEASEIFAALGWGERFSPQAFWPVTLPAWLEKRQAATDAPVKTAPRHMDEGAATHVLTASLASLAKRTRRAVADESKSQWSEYTGTLTHYTPEQAQAKQAWVSLQLSAAAPATVLDIGANTGDFSALAAGLGARVTALERDAAAADRIYRRSVAKGLPIQTIHADLARPTPAVGVGEQRVLWPAGSPRRSVRLCADAGGHPSPHPDGADSYPGDPRSGPSADHTLRAHRVGSRRRSDVPEPHARPRRPVRQPA